MPMLKMALLAMAGVLVAGGARAADLPFVVGDCVRPRVSKVVPGDYRKGILDTVTGDTPAVLAGPAGAQKGKLAAGTSYSVAAVRQGYLSLTGTKYSKPFPEGSPVGWVRAGDVHDLALRNCN